MLNFIKTTTHGANELILFRESNLFQEVNAWHFFFSILKPSSMFLLKISEPFFVSCLLSMLCYAFVHLCYYFFSLTLHQEIIFRLIWLIWEGMNISTPDIWLAGKPRTIEPWCVTVAKKKKKRKSTEYFCTQHWEIHAHTRTRTHSKALIWPTYAQHTGSAQITF